MFFGMINPNLKVIRSYFNSVFFKNSYYGKNAFLCTKTSNKILENFNKRKRTYKKLKIVNNFYYSHGFLPAQFDSVTSFVIFVVIGYMV